LLRNSTVRLTRLTGKRLREAPRDATLISHKYLLRGGYARQVGAGIYSILPLGKRVLTRIEAIIRAEMNAIDGQEVLMPVVMPREMWEESGRYAAIDRSMVRFKDRNDKDLVLGMTHEEAVVTLARTEASSYKQYPFMLYQIQTKFRDELRSRGGLVRVREFTMKDAYSFHTSKEDLESYYMACYRAYERIFRRAGLKHAAVVESDTGMMGGAVAHEFMLVTPVGEDSLVFCPKCRYAANNEVAVARVPAPGADGGGGAPVKVATPGKRTIEDVSGFLGVPPTATAKTLVFIGATAPKSPKSEPGRKVVVVVLRGDREVNDVKLAKAVRDASGLRIASEAEVEELGGKIGYMSPNGLRLDGHDAVVLVDPFLAAGDFVAGADEPDHHVTGFRIARDVRAPYRLADVTKIQDSDACSACDGRLTLARGIEIGNIFQLGTKYSQSMGMSYLDAQGKPQTPIMGCYGIGVGRLMAAAIEDCHDDYGPVWPVTIAPFEVHVCALQYGDARVRETADRLYAELRRAGLEVLLDDGDDKPGVQFADADLIGCPLRLIVSPKALDRGGVEYKLRDGSAKGDFPLASAVQDAVAVIARLRAQLES
jgi:prolyl-tRNA synthetase